MANAYIRTREHVLTRYVRRLIASAVLLLISGVAATSLVRLAPGLSVDERALNIAYNSSDQYTVTDQSSVVSTYISFLRGALKGDFGESSAFGAPVRALISARAGVTVRSVLSGFLTAWGVALLISAVGQLRAGWWLRIAGNGLAGVLVCMPSAVIAFSCVALGLSVGAGVGTVVFPRVLRYCDNVLSRAMQEPFVASARCRGVSDARVVLNHALRATAPQLVTLAGVTFTVACGAAIPMEVLADSAGLGQLAWRGALARDLSLVVTITLAIACVTLVANTVASVLVECIGGGEL